MQSEHFVHFILAIAPLLVVSLGLRAMDRPKPGFGFWLSAFLFALSFVLPASKWAGALVIPWLIYTLYLLWEEVPHRWQSLLLKKTQQADASRLFLAAFLYLPIGAAWAFADRWGFRPMNFSPIIVLLTGVHFHYAGFALPLVSALLLQQAAAKTRKVFSAFASWGVSLGVPLVALGITSSQFDWPFIIELAAVSLMASAGLTVGLAYIVLGRRKSSWQSGLFILGGLALASGMCLALLYGWRYVMPLSFLSIPWMYAVHGSLNSLGFVIPVLLAWNLSKK